MAALEANRRTGLFKQILIYKLGYVPVAPTLTDHQEPFNIRLLGKTKFLLHVSHHATALAAVKGWVLAMLCQGHARGSDPGLRPPLTNAAPGSFPVARSAPKGWPVYRSH